MENKKEKKEYYSLAKSWVRIFSRVIDQLIVIGVIIGIGCIFAACDNNPEKWNFNFSNKYFYLGIGIISFVLYAFYFLILPIISKGRTIGNLILKIKYVYLFNQKLFIVGMIKREFFIWFIPCICTLIVSLSLVTYKDDPYKLLLFFIGQKDADPSLSQPYEILVHFLQAFYGIGTLLLIFVIINVCMNNKKRAFIDHISNVIVVAINSKGGGEQVGVNEKITTKRNYGLPGEILSEGNEEISGIE